MPLKNDIATDLQSDSPHARLKAARQLAKNASSQDIPALRIALQRETVSWVRRALLIALDSKRGVASPKPSALTEAVGADIRSEAVHEVTRTLLHEFEPLIGIIRMHAQNEIPNFDASRTRADLDRLDLLVDAIQALKRASSSPKISQFDLASLISEVVGDHDNLQKISLVGPRPLMVDTDAGLLRLAFENGIRNAVEAVVSVDEHHPVTVSWGMTDVDVWITIIDLGAGLGAGSQGAFAIGTSTKKGHSGMGLPIAKQAIDSLDGEISLSPNSPRGARFEIRWFRSIK